MCFPFRRLRDKEREQRELEEKCQRLARERETKLALAREQKRHLKENNVPEPVKRAYPEDDQRSGPYAGNATPARMPLFDRSAKPLADHNHNVRTRDLDVVQRDFAPVYGSVVSRMRASSYLIRGTMVVRGLRLYDFQTQMFLLSLCVCVCLVALLR